MLCYSYHSVVCCVELARTTTTTTTSTTELNATATPLLSTAKEECSAPDALPPLENSPERQKSHSSKQRYHSRFYKSHERHFRERQFMRQRELAERRRRQSMPARLGDSDSLIFQTATLEGSRLRGSARSPSPVAFRARVQEKIAAENDKRLRRGTFARPSSLPPPSVLQQARSPALTPLKPFRLQRRVSHSGELRARVALLAEQDTAEHEKHDSGRLRAPAERTTNSLRALPRLAASPPERYALPGITPFADGARLPQTPLSVTGRRSRSPAPHFELVVESPRESAAAKAVQSRVNVTPEASVSDDER